MTDEAHDGPRNGLRWFPLNVGSALVLATVISLLAFMLLSDGEDSVTIVPLDTAGLAESIDVIEGASSPIAEVSAPATTIAPAAAATESRGVSRELSGGDVAISEFAPEGGQGLVTPVVVAMSSPEFGSGPTEVAVVTNFPAVTYTWERVVLPSSGYFDMSWIGELDGGLMAVGSSWDEPGVGEPGEQTLVTWSAVTGSEWTQLSAISLPQETWISRVVAGEDRLFAMAEVHSGEDFSTSYSIMTTDDGITWTTEDLPVTRAAADEHVYIQDAVAGPAGIALSLQYETYPPEPSQRLIFDEYEVEIDHVAGEFILTETASGDVVLTGAIEDLYYWNDVDGQLIMDPVNRDVLTVVPWEVWEQSYVDAYEGGYGGSPLPIPVTYDESYEPPVVTIEHDGYIITLDEGAGTFAVLVAANGEEVARGPLDVLYQGPPPEFLDPGTDEVILSVTWDEWYQAEGRAWDTHEYTEPEFNYSSRTSVLTSPNGETWSEEILNDGSNGAGVSLTATDNGFIAVVTTYGDVGEQRNIWRMVDGVWSSTETEQNQLWLYNARFTGDGFVAIGDGPTGQAVWSSPDGISWATEFTAAPQTEGEYVWFNSVATDGDGLVGVLATREAMYEFQPLVIEQDRYTAVFEEGEAVVRITETVSGAEVLVLTWEDFEFGSAAETVTRESDSMVFALDNGDVMVITDEEAAAAVDQRFAGSAYSTESSVFLKSGAGWSEAVVDSGAGLSGASQLFLSGDRIVVGGNHWDGYASEFESPETTAVILIGTPVGG